MGKKYSWKDEAKEIVEEIRQRIVNPVSGIPNPTEVQKEMIYNKKFVYDPLPENLKKHVVNFDEFWKQAGIYAEGFYDVYADVPMVHLSGWYDPYARTAVENYAGLSARKRGTGQWIKYKSRSSSPRRNRLASHARKAAS